MGTEQKNGRDISNGSDLTASNSNPAADFHYEPLKTYEPLKSGDSSSLRKRQPHGLNRTTPTVTPSGSERSSRSGSSESVPIPSLHGSLLRNMKNRDPLRFYEVIEVLGDGSMGSVSKVKKKKSAVGGSSRAAFVKEERLRNCCFLGVFCPKALLGATKNNNAIVEPIADPSSDTKKTVVYSESRSSSLINFDESKDVIYALKSIHLDRCRDSVFRRELMNEVAILQRLDHPHIVRAMETFDYHSRLYLVLEICSGGDLYARDPYDEKQACEIVHSMVDALAYMHSKNITHRDLKFENIMFANPESSTVKIIDFGLSKKYAGEEVLHDTVGTVYTMAPEVLKGDYDNKCDIWSVGVIAFMLLSSSLPFYGKTRQHVVRKILHHKYGFKGPRWRQISNKAKEFITSALTTDPRRRPCAEEMLKTSWLQRNLETQAPISFVLMDTVQATIQTYAEYRQLKKLALLVVAHKSTEEQIGFLRKVFRQFDTDENGDIDLEEFKKALTVYHYGEDELERMFDAMDLDGTQQVHYSEFLAATIEAHGSISEERIAEAFDRLDCDDSGYITVQNLKDFFGEHDNISEEYVESIIDAADVTNDHRISYDEFLGLWNDKDSTRFKHALKDATYRRETFDEGDMSRQSSFDDDMDVSTASADSSELGGGNYFYTKEKEKSVRGVWV